jgi:uncharacterized protein with HEPN domain
MTERSKKYLSDILLAIDLIEDFFDEIKTYMEYQMDLKTKSAIERQLGIIGEAVNKYKQEGNADLSQTQQIIQFRNRLIHAYDSIDDSIVWVIIKNHLPGLKQEIIKLLK